MPNLFAYGMIILWPFIAIVLYKRFDTVTATFWTIVGGYMFLPAKTMFDLPVLLIDKDAISALAALFCCIHIKRVKIYFFGINSTQRILITLIICIPIINVIFNQEPMFNGQIWIEGLTPYDAFVAMSNQYIRLLPFIIGISICNKANDLDKIIKLLIKAGLIYSILFLIEVRFSPQLHTWIYGFFPHSFLQQIRYGSVRPVVFMGHGLFVATFYMVCLCVSAIELKESKNKAKAFAIFCFFTMIMLTTKTVGATILASAISISILFFHLRIQRVFSIFLLLIFFVYPTLSIFNLIPYEYIIESIRAIDSERADSMDVRFNNEIMLLDHIREKYFIGWGGMARNRFYNTVSDGYWLIVFSLYGFFYFFAYFALFGLGVLYKTNSAGDKNINPKIVNVSLLLSMILIDQLPNSSLNHGWLWLLSGCFYSYVSARKAKIVQKVEM